MKVDSPLVSIIMPVFNCDEYVSEAIDSVLYQTYQNWELLVINDGSTDLSKKMIMSFEDRRIRYFEQQNNGVSAARNLALRNKNGDYFCFLDADDAMPPESLSSRIKVFQEKSDVSFVDGRVIYVNGNMMPTGNEYVPTFKGFPYDNLLKLNGSCYFGPSWMIRNDILVKYSFKEGMTHAEDLLFYLTISNKRKYDYTTKPVLYYRDNPKSAMKNLLALEQGYFMLLQSVKNDLNHNFVSFSYLKYRVMRIMFLSHLIDGQNPYRAIRSAFRYLIKV